MTKQGHASAFAHPTKAEEAIVEQQTVREWCTSIRSMYDIELTGVRSSDHPNKDVPDCWALLGDRKISIELKELLRGKLCGPNKNPTYNEKQWTKEQFFEELLGLFVKAQDQAQRNGITLDVLLIHTDEPWLLYPKCTAWLDEETIERHPNIKSAFLMHAFSIPNDTKYWPVHQLYGLETLKIT